MNFMKLLSAIGLIIFFFFISLFLGALLTADSNTPVNKPGIAIIKIDHDITFSRETSLFSSVSGVKKTIKMIEQAKKNENVKGVLFEINSPGGTPVATQELARSIARLKQVKPTVAWIGEIGASGAYWVATECNYTMADPLSITGSIGVRAQRVDMSRLFSKLGLNYTTFKAGEFKDIGSAHRPVSEEEKKIMNAIINETHYYFISAVAKNRNKSYDEIAKLATGEIFTGNMAKENGLIDDVGSRQDAILKTSNLSLLGQNPRIINLESTPSFVDILTKISSSFGYGVGIGISTTFEQGMKINSLLQLR